MPVLQHFPARGLLGWQDTFRSRTGRGKIDPSAQRAGNLDGIDELLVCKTIFEVRGRGSALIETGRQFVKKKEKRANPAWGRLLNLAT